MNNNRNMDGSFGLFGGAIPENENKTTLIKLNSYDDFTAHVEEVTRAAQQNGKVLNQDIIDRASSLVQLAFAFAKKSGTVLCVYLSDLGETEFNRSVTMDCEVAGVLDMGDGLDIWREMIVEAHDFVWATIIDEDAPEVLNTDNIDEHSFVRFTFGLGR